MVGQNRGLPVAEVMAASRGMLQRQLYVIETVPVAGLDHVLPLLEEHLAFQVSLERDGILFAAGPIWSDDETTWDGTGMVVVRAASRAEAVAIAERDPMHAKGGRRFTVRPWMVNEGTVSVRLNYSTQKFEIL